MKQLRIVLYASLFINLYLVGAIIYQAEIIQQQRVVVKQILHDYVDCFDHLRKQ